MRKILESSPWLLCVTALLWLSACGSESVTGVQNASQLEGKWYITSQTTKGNFTMFGQSQNIDETESYTKADNYYFDLKSDGTFVSRRPPEEEMGKTEPSIQSGTWSVSDGKLTLTDENGQSTQMDASISGGKLTVKMDIKMDLGDLGNSDLDVTAVLEK